MTNSSKEKKTRTPFFNFSGWLDVNSIARGAQTIKHMARSLFIPAQAKRVESFEEAMARLHLSEQDLQTKIKTFRVFFLFFFSTACALLIYALYLLIIADSFIAGFAAVGLGACLLGQAFHYHFWLFQMKNRKLGCSLNEWFMQGVLGINKGLEK